MIRQNVDMQANVLQFLSRSLEHKYEMLSIELIIWHKVQECFLQLRNKLWRKYAKRREIIAQRRLTH